MCVCVCMQVCVCVCVYLLVCMRVCMCVYMCACTDTCVWVRVCTCILHWRMYIPGPAYVITKIILFCSGVKTVCISAHAPQSRSRIKHIYRYIRPYNMYTCCMDVCTCHTHSMSTVCDSYVHAHWALYTYT